MSSTGPDNDVTDVFRVCTGRFISWEFARAAGSNPPIVTLPLSCSELIVVVFPEILVEGFLMFFVSSCSHTPQIYILWGG